MESSSQNLATFDFEGREIAAGPGTTIAAALIAAGELALRQSRQGDCRGVFCGMGVCQECLVAVDGKPAQRACMTAVQPGMVVQRSPALAQLDQARLAAGAEDQPSSAARAPSEELLRHCDLLVIGGGPGGLSAAATGAEAGLDVVLLDERAKLGGQYFKQPAAGDDSKPPADAQFAAGKALIQRVLASGAEVHSATSVWGAFGLDAICATTGSGRWRFSCDALILAPGAHERAVPFPGWTLPGVMTTGAAQTLWRSYGVSPGERVLIAGNGPLNMQVAAELTAGGATVVGVAELAPAPLRGRVSALMRMARADPGLIRDGLRYRAVLARARVPVMYGSLVSRVQGEGQVRTAVVSAADSSGRVREDRKRFEVDAVCLGLGFVPSSEIARALGCRHDYSAAGHLVTVTSDRGATSADGIWVIGDGSTIRGARHAQAHGEIAALDAIRLLGRTVSESLAERERRALRAAVRHQRFQSALAEVYKAPCLTDELTEPETYVCRCEGVSRRAIDRALAAGAGHIGTIKRETRAGMGPCQGRYCGPLIAAMVARATGQPPGEFSGFAPSPPVRPVEVGELIGITD